VRNHAGGTRMGIGVLISKEKRTARRRDEPGSGTRTLRLSTMEGRSLDNPTRGNPAVRPGRKDRNASGKSAPRSGGSRSQNERTDVRTDRRSSGTGARERAPRSRRAAVNGQGAATSIGFFPPRWHLTVRWHGADHAPAHAARTRTRSKEPKSTSARSNVRGGSLMQRSRSPTVRRKRLDRKVRPPLKTR